MLVKPERMIDRDLEWAIFERFAEREKGLAIVYGPRRVGKSFLLDAVCEATGGRRYQAIGGVAATQLADFGRELGEWLGAGPLRIDGWADALERLAKVELPFIALDELPYLTEVSPEIPSLLQRYVDAGEGPSLIVSGSALSVMSDLVESRAPLYGRAAAVVVPAPLGGADLTTLWGTDDPLGALWIDAVLGGLPGYRPLVESPGSERNAWMIEEVLSAGSPLLDAAEADLANVPELPALRGVYRAILAAIAAGERSFSAISRVAGLPSGALSRPLATLQRAGLIERVVDPLRSRRDRYELADPHLRFWLAIVSPSRSRLQAGAAAEVWKRVGTTTWPSQVLGPRWESVVRDHIARGGEKRLGAPDLVGTTSVSDRRRRESQELDLIAMRDKEIVALGETKLRKLDATDLDRLLYIRDLLEAPAARLILASATEVDAHHPDLIAVGPADVYA
jgi:uncharacterized protein